MNVIRTFLISTLPGRFSLLVMLLPLLCACAARPPAAVGEQKIVFIRHAEKPAAGLGMVNCQGLNRALALPPVLLGKFGKPGYVFASDPHDQKPDDGGVFNYLRPVLTIAPTAVQAGLPVNTSFGFEDTAGLRRELEGARYANALVFVAWEHKELEVMVKALLDGFGADKTVVPRWKGSDFDSIYVVTVRRSVNGTTASFAIDHQQLNGQNTACPGPAPKP